MIMKFRKHVISATEAVKLAFGPELFFSNDYLPSEIANENRVIHQMLGADNTDEVELNLGDWTIKGIPDKVLNNRIIEVKVQRPLSKPQELLTSAAYQGLIYASALGLDVVEVWLYVYSTGEVKTYSFPTSELNPAEFFTVLGHNLRKLEELQAFRPPKLESMDVNKLALVVKKYE
jgi:hypothetical protein